MDTLEISNKFHKQLDDLIKLHIEYRKTSFLREVEISMSPVAFAMECGTVKCDIGRQTGKTEYIRRYADSESLVIVSTKNEAGEYAGSDFDVFSVMQIMDNKVRKKSFYKMIYIEEPTLVFRKVEANSLYGELVDKYQQQVFVQLGT